MTVKLETQVYGVLEKIWNGWRVSIQQCRHAIQSRHGRPSHGPLLNFCDAYLAEGNDQPGLSFLKLRNHLSPFRLQPTQFKFAYCASNQREYHATFAPLQEKE